jgi:hypothetical protein
MVAYYTEIYFLQNDIRFIAVNDAIDTYRGENEIMGFKSILNEYYARDISKKVRSSKRTSALKGEFIGSRAPYGYIKDPKDKHKLLVDDNAANVVRRLFSLAESGTSVAQIRQILIKDKILIPTAYMFEQTGNYGGGFNHDFPYAWTKRAIINILQSKVYIGCMVSGKQRIKSFKYKILENTTEDEWIVVEDTHEPIIDKDTFDKVQPLVAVKHQLKLCSIDNIFLGKLICSDCGHHLTFGTYGERQSIGRYSCNTYKNNRNCTPHNISYKALYEFVLEEIQNQIKKAKVFDGDTEAYIKSLLESISEDNLTQIKSEVTKAKNRLSDIGKITKKMFEQSALGAISDEQFSELTADYTKESAELRAKINSLNDKIAKNGELTNGAEAFSKIIGKYENVETLTAELVGDFIDKIVVFEATGARTKNREQRIDIYYRYIGSNPV